MSEETLNTLRELESIRDTAAPNANQLNYDQFIAKRMPHEEIQTYLLLKILDRLETIEKRLWEQQQS